MGFVIFWMICAALAYAVAGKDGKGMAIVLGLLLGPIGIVVAAVLNKDGEKAEHK